MKAALNMYLRAALRFVPVMAVSLVIGCSPASTSTSTGSADKFIRPMSAPCIWKRDEPYRWEGYNDKPVDACLGPHHYRIPANYFYDQMGPDFQASIGLIVQWPELQPFAPGKRDERGMEGFYKTVVIHPVYVDRVPMTEYLENSIRSLTDKEDPIENVALMDRRPQRFGLTPYYVNPEKFDAYWRQQDLRNGGQKSNVPLRNAKDWYLAHDAQGRLTTVIQCDSHLEPDGLLIQGDRLLDDHNSSTNAVCMHTFVIAEDKVVFHVDYGRVLLKDWKRFEDRARELLKTYRVR